MTFPQRLAAITFGLTTLLALAGCQHAGPPPSSTATPGVRQKVVLYCSVDDIYAKPIIQRLAQKTGLRIEPLFDTEAAKTAGLTNRIRAEYHRPQGDVFWSSALLQVLLLNRDGLIQPYQSPAARAIPAAFKAADGAWTGMAARARLVIFHTGAGLAPHSIADLAARQQVGIGNPLFGASSDGVAALAARWGVPKTLAYFHALKKNGVRVLAGSSVAAEKVAHGDLLYGMADTDDYFEQSRRTGTISTIMPPPADTVVVPVCVAMIKNAPHPKAARKLIDALLDPATEQQLAVQMPGALPLRSQQVPPQVAAVKGLAALPSHAPNDTARWPAAWDAIRDPLAEILLRD